MKALFFSLPLHGHTNPSLPLIRELESRGDQIVYYSTDAFASKVQQHGGTYRPYRNHFLSEMAQLPERLHELSWLLMRTSAEVLSQQLDEFRAEQPGYVIADSVAPWGQWVARILKVPLITSVSTFAINRKVLAYGLKHGVRPKSVRTALSKLRHMGKALLLARQLGRRYAMKGPGPMASVMGRSELNIVYTSRFFQPCADTFDQRYCFIGPSLPPREQTIVHQASRTPLVYISMGTLFNADPAFYRQCFEAFAKEDFHVTMATGTNVTLESLGTAPENFTVSPHVPQLEVLERASVFVSHGGMNSVNESLYYGVPLVVIPQMSEQQVVGRRVEELGAGLYLEKTLVTAENLRNSVRRVFEETELRRRAELVGESFRTAGGVTRAVDAIRAITQRPGS